ncbi:hypothetical protein AAG570_008031 [Ranatra chinensis]|uniref:Transmembrane protein 131 n=1 Tax=Ranatra chinensis TaxID=642074 RepID=A0ABD0Y8U9_9HEMI
MSSISGNTVHFHSSFFQDKVIPPLGNTTFNVVFLGRGEGDIESNLFIHTSEGSIKYQVRGESVGSPYRLRPLSGVRLPLNASYSPLILMHNPHASPLQLVEVYSSGGDFHLELPSGELEGPKHLWQIPAFLTKPIIRLKFHASAQKNHTAYIRLKVDRSGEVLVVPVEVEVGPVCGLYSPDDLIDFGIGGSEDAPKQINLYLRNSWKKPIRVQNVISMPVSKALKIDFQPVKVPPDEKQPTQVAVLSFDWKAALETGHTSGRIIIKSNQGSQKLIMAYTSTVLAGGLAYNTSQTKFQSDRMESSSHLFELTNKYKVPVAVTNATLASEAAFYFELADFSPIIIMPGETEKLLTLSSKGGSLPKDLKLDSTIKIYSNASTLYVPLLCYHGRLIKVIPSDTSNMELNLGTVGSGSTSVIYFSLVNENPVDIKLLQWGSNITGAVVDVVTIKKGNISDAIIGATLMQYSNITIKDATLPPGHYCIVQVAVPTGLDIGYHHGNVMVRTKFENIITPLHMKIEHGSLRVLTDPVVFYNCFPSAVCRAEVRVESRFTVGMAVTGLSSIPYQTKLGFVPVSPPIIPPGGNILLGHITWDMSGFGGYLTASANITGGLRWHDTLELPAHTREWDLSLLTTRYEHYLNMSAQLIELTLRLDTTEVRNVGFQAHIQPSWPSVVQVPSHSIHFPMTQVGNITFKYMTIFNPASKYPIIVQLVLDPSYPLAAGIVHELPPSLRPNSCNVCCETTGEDVENVFLISVEGATPFQSGIQPHKNSKTFSLAPASSLSVKLAFKPISAEFSSSILMIRNNLTILETVQLTGTGAYAQFKFGNRKPGSTSPLLFELNEKHLKDCDISGENIRKHPGPNFTVKRSFTARNTGALPLTVIGFTINGQPCQGFGFRVLNCQSFQLPANSTRKVDIAFTPDFTLTRVSRILSVITMDSKANYSLVATLPPYLLLKCSVILNRPAWEPLLYYSAVNFMVFLLICVLAAAFFESNRILQNAIIAMSRESVQPVLDLRLDIYLL